MRVSNFASPTTGRCSRSLATHPSRERRRTRAASRRKGASSVARIECSSDFTRASFVAAPPTKINEDGSVSVPTRLSGTPMSREARRWFYEDAALSVDAALNSGKGVTRASVKLVVPETNPEQDTFRVGTLLELVRAIAVRRARERGERVRVVVQGPLGEGFFKGMPLSLSGVSSLLSRMDWGEEEGGDGGGPAAKITTGILGGGDDDADDDEAVLGSPPCDLLIVVAPQNIVGGSVWPDLMRSARAAERNGASVVLVNSILKDVQSSGGVMSVRGRDERLADAATFVPAYHLRLLFANPTIPFPIRGALRLSWFAGEGKEPEWQVYSREDVDTASSSTSTPSDDDGASALAAPLPWSQRETFILAGSLPLDLGKDKGGEPTSTEITAFLRERRERVAAAERAVRESDGDENKRRGWWW